MDDSWKNRQHVNEDDRTEHCSGQSSYGHMMHDCLFSVVLDYPEAVLEVASAHGAVAMSRAYYSEHTWHLAAEDSSTRCWRRSSHQVLQVHSGQILWLFAGLALD